LTPGASSTFSELIGWDDEDEEEEEKEPIKTY
jgi:hypothetical protein